MSELSWWRRFSKLAEALVSVGAIVDLVAAVAGVRRVWFFVAIDLVVLVAVWALLQGKWGKPLGWRELAAAASATAASLVLLLVVVDLLAPPFPYVTLAKQPSVSCVNPAADSYCRFVVQGASGGHRVWHRTRLFLLVHPLKSFENDWYLQWPSPEVGSDGQWTAVVQAGHEANPVRDGDQFAVMVMMVGPDAHCDTPECQGKPIDEKLLGLDFPGSLGFSGVEATTVSGAIKAERPQGK